MVAMFCSSVAAFSHYSRSASTRLSLRRRERSDGSDTGAIRSENGGDSPAAAAVKGRMKNVLSRGRYAPAMTMILTH